MISIITTIKNDNPASKGFRSVGFFFDMEQSQRIVENNIGDISECGYYRYCVIEVFDEGIYQESKEEIWYVWYSEQNRYVRCLKPNNLKMFVNYGIG